MKNSRELSRRSLLGGVVGTAVFGMGVSGCGGADGVAGAGSSVLLSGDATARAPRSAAASGGAASIGLGALVCDTYNAYRWAPPSPGNTWTVLQQLRENGLEWARMWVTTRSFPELRTNSDWSQFPWQTGYWSCLEVAGAILSEAQAQGLRLQAVLFINDQTANAGSQPMPAAWAGLTASQLAEQVRLSSAATASYFKSLGLAIEVFEIGNEIDFGILGMGLGRTVTPPPGTDWTTDTNWMHTNVWAPMAPLLQAAIDGVRSVYPDAKMLLHIAGFGYSPGNVLTAAFFKSMIDSGVAFDIAGLSYPYMFNQGPALPQPYFAQQDFQSALSAIAALGKSVQIVEFDYPAASVGTVQTPSPLYPFTPDGQAAFVRDFASAIRGKVERLFYWYPDYYTGFRNGANPELESCGLFDTPATPRPALATLKTIGSGTAACLFDHAEQQYGQYFPAASKSTGTYASYTYRYYPTTQNYLAVSSTDNHVYVLGPSFGPDIVHVGPAASFLAAFGCP